MLKPFVGNRSLLFETSDALAKVINDDFQNTAQEDCTIIG